jgi:hypothetical protein
MTYKLVVYLRHMVVQVVPSGERLGAVLAWPENCAREMTIFHVFLHVAALAANAAAQRAPVPVVTPLYVGVQALQAACEHATKRKVTK